MTSPNSSTYVYVIYIRSTPQAVWSALTDPDTLRRYWYGMHQDSDWKPGSTWRMVRENGETTDDGEILEAAPPHRMAIKWRNAFRPELTAEGYSTCVYELEAVGEAVKLTVTHSIGVADSKLIVAVSGGWPQILSNLKSMLETGQTILAR
jgi:uncharacterized protein YndB with AHSA1/START domain